MICPATILINLTLTWTKFDQDTLTRAKTRCGQLYQDAPCVKKFTKKEELAYLVACGPKRMRNYEPAQNR